MGEYFMTRQKTKHSSALVSSRKPKRTTAIQKEEVISLVIDLNWLSTEEFLKKYCHKVSSK